MDGREQINEGGFGRREIDTLPGLMGEDRKKKKKNKNKKKEIEKRLFFAHC
jgi:hypothetical protein